MFIFSIDEKFLHSSVLIYQLPIGELSSMVNRDLQQFSVGYRGAFTMVNRESSVGYRGVFTRGNQTCLSMVWPNFQVPERVS